MNHRMNFAFTYTALLALTTTTYHNPFALNNLNLPRHFPNIDYNGTGLSAPHVADSAVNASSPPSASPFERLPPELKRQTLSHIVSHGVRF